MPSLKIGSLHNMKCPGVASDESTSYPERIGSGGVTYEREELHPN